jgi:hypothetical protein
MSLTREVRATSPMALSWGRSASETRSTLFRIVPLLSGMPNIDASVGHSTTARLNQACSLSYEARQPRPIATALLRRNGRFDQRAT